MPPENIYWLFSSSAQSISAFVALLLAGFTLVHSMMESAQQKDETLVDIHSGLMTQYYNWIRIIAILTALAIIGSLTMVFLNPYTFPLKIELMVTISIIDTLAVILGIIFVIIIIDPNKYKKTAQRLIQDDNQRLGLIGPSVSDADFFKEFVLLEKDLRIFVQTQKIFELQDRIPLTPVSFRDLANAIYRFQIIDSETLDELLEVNKYRNLVFHGQINEVDEKMVEKLKLVAIKLRNILKQYRVKRKRR